MSGIESAAGGKGRLANGAPMPGAMRVRAGRLADGDRVARIWAQMMRYHARISPNDYRLIKDAPAAWLKLFRRSVRSPGMKALVAERGGRVIGYLLGSVRKRPPCYRTKTQGFISDLAVAEGEKNRGAGTALVKAFLPWARKKGVKYISLSVDPNNSTGMRFWKKMGFQTVMLEQRKIL